MSTVAFVFAHPDDESFLSGALIIALANEGHHLVEVLATRGDAGHNNGPFVHYTREQLGQIREKEMEQAAAVLGLSVVEHLAYPDGKLREQQEGPFIARVTDFLNRHHAEVVVTFPEDGVNHHPDHVTISRIATQAVLSGQAPGVRKLYYLQSQNPVRKPSVRIDTEPYWKIKTKALRAHESQQYAIQRHYGDLNALSEQRRYESFVLAWENGVHWPTKQEASVVDGLQTRQSI